MRIATDIIRLRELHHVVAAAHATHAARSAAAVGGLRFRLVGDKRFRREDQRTDRRGVL